MNYECRSKTGLPSKVFVSGMVLLLIATVALVIWYAVEAFLLIFAGMLLGIFFRLPAAWIAKHLHLRTGWALLLFLSLLFAAISVCGWFLVPTITSQFERLQDQIPEAVARVHEELQHHPTLTKLLDKAYREQRILPDGRIMYDRAAGIFSTVLGALTGLAVVLALGIYFALEPDLYKRGLIRLVKPEHRARTQEIFDAVSTTLHWWLVGRLISMSIIGVFTSLGLLLLGIPLALFLGVIAAALTFIPNIGPVLSVVPAVLLGLLESPVQAMGVVALYLVTQLVESYLITPLIQRQAISMPPALTISAQLLLGYLMGGLGLVLATPLVAAAKTAVELAYVEDLLEERGQTLRAKQEAPEHENGQPQPPGADNEANREHRPA